MPQPTILIGISGGLDSAVSALLLQRRGFAVTALMLAMHGGKKEKESYHRARSVCTQLGIPLWYHDIRDKFHTRIKQYSQQELLMGRTPNPCIRCNETIKFRRLLSFARYRGIGTIATGHYACTGRQQGRAGLWKAADRRKDQSYVLYRLGPFVLTRAILPLCRYTKEEVEQLGKESFPGLFEGIPSSQDLCFSRHIHGTAGSGDFRDKQGRLLGRHGGFFQFTIGQRKGLGLPDGPWYVTDIHPATNTVVVGSREEVSAHRILCRDAVVYGTNHLEGAELSALIRYRARPVTVRIEELHREDRRFTVHADEPFTAPTPGQSLVLYDGTMVVGGGIIANTERRMSADDSTEYEGTPD
ncbi:MAG: tRNA 2-thiouridine(34) synthase MnmA [Synergistales bacterium]|nr:tRNA 2-thiouridine(34) synthase MnmA [Synergistales bacterium]